MSIITLGPCIFLVGIFRADTAFTNWLKILGFYQENIFSLHLLNSSLNSNYNQLLCSFGLDENLWLELKSLQGRAKMGASCFRNSLLKYYLLVYYLKLNNIFETRFSCFGETSFHKVEKTATFFLKKVIPLEQIQRRKTSTLFLSMIYMCNC